ncbi:LptA/OstA family protein [Robiginitomaculum antarcticum]|uniref:LptA/OstA family protein n=1 Tax=Robiginitomaculum antarcticum TaxID=437507 RepID=UPI00037E5C7B|nr:LptA/OstA family protein [Robiginitomaculum antarcticum]
MRKFLLLATIGATFLAAVPAQAQFALGSGNVPTKIDADKADYKGRITILTGQVQVQQGDVRILADRMDVYRTDLGGGKLGPIERIDAVGNFFYITPTEKVKGEKGVYEETKGVITITGDVVLEDSSGNVGTGKKLVYNLESKEAVMQGDCKGRPCTSGRVGILIPGNGGQQ